MKDSEFGFMFRAGMLFVMFLSGTLGAFLGNMLYHSLAGK